MSGSGDPIKQRSSVSAACDWFLKPWRLLNTPHGVIAYLSATGCFFGAVFFVIESCAIDSSAVYANFTPGDGLVSEYDWLVLFCSMMGSKFFGMGCISLYILGNNPDYTQQLSAWKSQGKLGKKARFHLLGFRPSSYVWWGGVVYVLGSVQYNIASTCAFVHNFPRYYGTWSPNAVKWLTTVMYTSGGGCYFLAGLMYVLAATQQHSWKGTLIPTRVQNGFRLAWWATWMNFWGGLLYMIGGVFLNYSSRLSYHPAYQIQNTINYGGGSLCYIVAAVLSWTQMSLTANEASQEPALALPEVLMAERGKGSLKLHNQFDVANVMELKLEQ